MKMILKRKTKTLLTANTVYIFVNLCEMVVLY